MGFEAPDGCHEHLNHPPLLLADPQELHDQVAIGGAVRQLLPHLLQLLQQEVLAFSPSGLAGQAGKAATQCLDYPQHCQRGKEAPNSRPEARSGTCDTPRGPTVGSPLGGGMDRPFC